MVLGALSSDLIRRQLPCGGWPALASSAQAAVEPTCYSLLVLGSQATDVRRPCSKLSIARAESKRKLAGVRGRRP